VEKCSDSAIADFASAMKPTHIGRAHQCIESGIASFGKGTHITVFASSYYEVQLENSCEMLRVAQNGNISTR
jgi:hypothetical protein